jgi:hypothetical protein
MNAYAGNWSVSSETTSISLEGELHTEPTFAPPARKGRRVERIQVELGAGLRQRGASGVSVQVMDLSTEGFKAATHLELHVGTDVWLRLPGLESCQARVMWAEGHFIGCAFVRPLHPAVLDMIVARAKDR